jgi:hypothetical protein
METVLAKPVAATPPVTWGKRSARLGVISATLFLASLRWAHHWNPLTVAIVAGWAVATIAALVSSVWSLSRTQDSRTVAKVGLWLALPSVLAVTVGGAAAAGGADVPDCGGG